MIENVFNSKDDYQKRILELCEPLKKHYSSGKALLDIGNTSTCYCRRTIEFESFARPFWGLIPFFAGGGDAEFKDILLSGIKNGTDPDSDEYWGDCRDYDQAFVEMAVIGFGLMLNPDLIWKPLNDSEKANLNKWLLQINAYEFPPNNWLFFRVLVNCGLKNAGGEYSAEAIEKSLDTIETFYLGDGWYSDGKTLQRDYYVAFAIHFYSLIYAKTMKDIDPVRSKRFIDRAKLFAKEYVYWFSEDGEALPFGRSLTYRFAQASFWSALAFADVEVFSWGVIKGIVNRHFRWWFKNPILDGEGKLTIGYAYPDLLMSEGYNGPGSPYWSFKSFLILALDDDHPFWTAEEEALPELERVKAQKHPMMIVTRPQKSHIIALTSGQYANWELVHCAEKYGKFAYSSYFGFNVPRSYYGIKEAVPDNMLAFARDGLYHVRRRCDEVTVSENKIISKWRPMEGIAVETTLEPYKDGHLRTHKVTADYDCTAIECGFSLPVDDIADTKIENKENISKLQNINGCSGIELLEGEGVGKYVQCEANTNIVHSKTALPYIELHFKKGITKIKAYVYGIKGV